MSEPILDRLSKFTPDAGALDRDALLFAAGRASARPNRGWITLAAVLAGAQVLSLVFLWPQPSFTPPGSGTVVVHPTHSLPANGETGYLEDAKGPDTWMARHDLSIPASEERSAVVVTLTPQDPPLRAFAPPPSFLY
jgi:hypothetical protein